MGDRFLNDNESNETDTETPDENNNLSREKFMKKCKLPISVSKEFCPNS